MRSARPATLIVGCGNPSRGDDALGPSLIDEISRLLPAHAEWGEIETLTDFQLQIEFVLDLADRRRIVFVDATTAGAGPFSMTPLQAVGDSSLTTHALTPGALLSVFRRHFGRDAPPSHLLAIRGYAFELGAPLSPDARRNLDEAIDGLTHWLALPVR